MSNPFDDIRHALAHAQDTLAAADAVAYNMAKLLQGRMRKVNDKYALAALKRELQDFNAVTGKWNTDT